MVENLAKLNGEFAGYFNDFEIYFLNDRAFLFAPQELLDLGFPVASESVSSVGVKYAVQDCMSEINRLINRFNQLKAMPGSGTSPLPNWKPHNVQSKPNIIPVCQVCGSPI